MVNQFHALSSNGTVHNGQVTAHADVFDLSDPKDAFEFPPRERPWAQRSVLCQVPAEGKAVEVAVWNETLPSTFCVIWWMCPFNTVTDPKRFRYERASAPSLVAPAHQSRDYTIQVEYERKITIGVDGG